MIAAALFWLLLAVPGFALLRRARLLPAEAGPLSAVAFSYVASFVLLAPVSIAGYALRLPIAVLSAAVAVSVLLGAVQLAFALRAARPWPAPASWPWPSAFALLACALLAFDLFASLRLGSHLSGDALYHAARARSLLDNGFNSWDPLASGRYFDRAYHTNLYHALIAACAQLTDATPAQAWLGLWFWTKLFAAATSYHLAFVVLGERRLSWLAVAVVVVWTAPYSVLPYPNTLASFALLPLALAFAVELSTRPPSAAPVLGLAAVLLVLVQVHALYYAFAALLIGPVLLGRLLMLQRRRAPGRRSLLAALLALGVGLPWLIVSATTINPTTPAPGGAGSHESPAAVAALFVDDGVAPTPEESSAARLDGKRFVETAAGRMLDPSWLKDPHDGRVHLLIALLVGLFTARRAQFLALSGALLVAFAVLHVPWLCEAMIRLLDAPWTVRRLEGVLYAPQLVLVAGALLLPLLARWPSPWLAAAGCAAALAYAVVYGIDNKPWTRAHYFAQLRDAGELREQIERHAQLRALLQRHVPARAAVVVDIKKASELAMDCNCHPFAARQVSLGLEDMAVRRYATGHLLDPKTPLPYRAHVVRSYGLRHLLVRKERTAKRLARAYGPLLKEHVHAGQDHLIVLDLEREVPAAP
jgi:hypothetical protein